MHICGLKGQCGAVCYTTLIDISLVPGYKRQNIFLAYSLPFLYKYFLNIDNYTFSFIFAKVAMAVQ